MTDELGIRPLDARSLVLSVLLGLQPPALPVRALVSLAEVFAIAPGTVRVALSRMVAAGELETDGGDYRLVGRLLDRKRAQDAGRHPPPSTWDDTWWVATVMSPRRTVTERRAFRSQMVNLRMGELRPDTWMRPANLPGPAGDGTLAVVRGPLVGSSSGTLARRLWPIDDIAARARSLRRHLDAALPTLVAADAAALPVTIGLAAATVRFLRTEPLLPAELTPHPWPPDDVRRIYADFDRAFGRALATVVRTVR